MDPLALRKRLQTIVEAEIPQFAANIRPTRLPIIDMTEASAQAVDTSNSIFTDLSRSNVEGLRKFWGDLKREIKALEKVLVPKLSFNLTRSPHSYTRGARHVWLYSAPGPVSWHATIKTRPDPTQKPLSTNSPYLLAVWAEVLSSSNVIAVCKSYPLVGSEKGGSPFRRGRSDHHSSKVVKVDVVSDNGECWTRLNTCAMLNALKQRDL